MKINYLPTKIGSRFEKVLNSFDNSELNGSTKTSKYDSKYDSKFETKYDTYDEDEMKSGAGKFYRSESPLKSSLGKSSAGLVGISPLSASGKNARSNSLDRLTSAYNSLTGSGGAGTSAGGTKFQK